MTPAIRKRLVQIGFLVLVQVVALFASVWKWNWWNAWAYLALYLVFLAFNAFILLGKHKELVEERSQIGEGAKGWDKVIGGISAFGGLLILILAGLDERFGWAGSIPLWVQIGAFVLLGLSYPLFTWAMVSNKFFSTIVRIQKDRGHTVQTRGPYRFVRHPGYASLLVSYLMIPLALGSLWAVIPALVLAINLLVRTALEDRTLQNELDGYKEYAGRVRYRLIPGIW
ncbi:MAG: isoprenylcysteine carboxylmethyltransferase family protein [Chloroflexi bacterium]|nr:MAG: isoprenylcysteine carboxylmethyltransferase family protein [Chloroflexota bacterium]